MKTRIVRIGNSQGVRIPKPLLEQAGLPEEVDVAAEAGRIIITPATAPRATWAEAAAAARVRNEDQLEAPTPTRFDDTDWTW